MKVIKRDGTREELDIAKIQKHTGPACARNNVSQSELEVDAGINFRDGITTKEVHLALEKTAMDKITIEEPTWTFVAAEIKLTGMYHEVGKIYNSKKVKYGHSVKDYVEKAIEAGRMLPDILEVYKDDFDKINALVDPERDYQFNYLGIKTLSDRYLLKNRDGKIIELPQHLFIGVAMMLAIKEENKIKWVEKFYNMISQFEVMLATPTLSNARTNRHQMSSCYVGATPDKIEGIFDTYDEMAILSKFGGGIGWDWTSIRSAGSGIDGHKGVAGGTIPFFKITNDIAVAVDQLGCVSRDSFVKIVDKVVTNSFTHNFRADNQPYELDSNDIIQGVGGFASEFAFEYGKLSKNFTRSLLFDYVTNKKGIDVLLRTYNLSRDQYKKIIGKYKKINKGLPEGFESILGNANYAISESGVVINVKTLRPIAMRLNKKGYVCVTLSKKVRPLHRLLANQFIEFDPKLAIVHDDGNKLNNNLDNLKVITNVADISKGCSSGHKKRTEKSRVRKHLTSGYSLNGLKTGTHNFEIVKVIEKIVPIDRVRVGDMILSYDISADKTEYKSVIAKHSIDVKLDDQIKVSFSDGNFIVTSKWHPFPKIKKEKVVYVRTDSLEVGDMTLNDKEEIVTITGVGQPEKHSDFFDLTVKDNNNYFCSTQSKEGNFHLIHNTRKGAIAVYLQPWHMDILDFLDLKKNSGEERRRTHDIFPALWINDLFMKRVQEDAKWTLFDPEETDCLTEMYGDEFEEKYLEFENDPKIRKEQIGAKDLWKIILRSYYETGTPFLCFKDEANKRNPNPHTGTIRSSNLCCEIFQNTRAADYEAKVEYEDGTVERFDEFQEVETSSGVKIAKKITSLNSIDGKQVFHSELKQKEGSAKVATCNLASINLSKVNTREDLARVIPIAVRALDNVVELNYFPTRNTRDTSDKTRSIGLGMMGEAELLATSEIHWGSEEHFELIDEICENFSFETINASSELAKERGSYKEFEGSNWQKGIFPIDNYNENVSGLIERKPVRDWDALKEKVKSRGLRNGYLMAIAPTSSISILVGTTQAIEPVYKRMWFEENLSGLIPNVVPKLSVDTWQYYTPAYEVDQLKVVVAGAIRQKWIDQGQSLNIFVDPKTTSARHLNDIYMLAWKLGNKSTYYLRSQSPETANDVEDRSMECVGCQ